MFLERLLASEHRTAAGLYKLNPIQLTHSLKAPGFNPSICVK
jgi:hypothetical protein